MSGNCASGMRVRAIAPASVVMIAMTIARRGLRMKTAEITLRAEPSSTGAGRSGRGSGAGAHRRPIPHALEALDDDGLAGREAFHHGRAVGRRLPEPDAALGGDVVLVHDEDGIALLV